MAQVYFKAGAPSAGSSYGFFAAADAALATYLTTSAGSLTTFLLAQNVTFRAHYPQDDARPDESKSNYPVVYIFTRSFTLEDFEAVSLTVDLVTELRVWTRHSDTQTAGAKCIEIAGAIASAIRQAPYLGGGTDWLDFYANYYKTGGTVAPVQSDVLTANEGAARMILTVPWQHYEEF